MKCSFMEILCMPSLKKKNLKKKKKHEAKVGK
jgi:hypothetical protein